jgi:hypothetical protein
MERASACIQWSTCFPSHLISRVHIFCLQQILMAWLLFFGGLLTIRQIIKSTREFYPLTVHTSTLALYGSVDFFVRLLAKSLAVIEASSVQNILRNLRPKECQSRVYQLPLKRSIETSTAQNTLCCYNCKINAFSGQSALQSLPFLPFAVSLD